MRQRRCRAKIWSAWVGLIQKVEQWTVDCIEGNDEKQQHLTGRSKVVRGQTDERHSGQWLSFFLVLLILPVSVSAQDAAKYFEDNCTVCHTIGEGPLAGPDLKGVTQRQQREWLIRFLRAPEAVINSGDPYAQQILQASGGIVMPDFPEVTPELASALLDFIEAKSQSVAQESVPPEPLSPEPESRPAEVPAPVDEISDRPFTPRDVEGGKQIFGGSRPLANGGPACFSCHGIRGFGGLGGGRLAPDLTRVYERLRGRKSLAAWLSAPPTTEMRSLFRQRSLEPEEIVLLVAYFEDAAKQGGEAGSAVILGFFFLALGGTIVALISFDAIWKRRLRTAREPLIGGAGLEGKS